MKWGSRQGTVSRPNAVVVATMDRRRQARRGWGRGWQGECSSLVCPEKRSTAVLGACVNHTRVGLQMQRQVTSLLLECTRGAALSLARSPEGFFLTVYAFVKMRTLQVPCVFMDVGCCGVQGADLDHLIEALHVVLRDHFPQASLYHQGW